MKKENVKQGYNYLDDSIQSMAEFFEIKIENIERFDSEKDSRRTSSTRKGNKLIRTFLKKNILNVQKQERNSKSIMVHVATVSMNVLPSRL